MSSLYTNVTSFILNLTVQLASNNAPIEISECFMFGKFVPVLLYLATKVNPNHLSSWILGHFALMIFVVSRTLCRWADTTMNFPVYPESATAEFLYFVSCMFLWLVLKRDCYIHIYFKIHCTIYHFSLMNYVSDHLPRLSFIIFIYARLIVCDLPIGLQRLSSFL